MPKKKTVRVRIAVAVGADGQWNSSGWSGESATDDAMEGIALDPMEDAIVNMHWVEADVPLPSEATTVEGDTASTELEALRERIENHAAEVEARGYSVMASGFRRVLELGEG